MTRDMQEYYIKKSHHGKYFQVILFLNAFDYTVSLSPKHSSGGTKPLRVLKVLWTVLGTLHCRLPNQEVLCEVPSELLTG